MATVDMDQAVELSIKVVRNAHANNKLQQLTNRLVRQEVEQTLQLGGGTLDEKQYKNRINAAIVATVEKLQVQRHDTDEDNRASNGERRESAVKPVTSTKKRKSVESVAAETKGKRRSPKAAASQNDDSNVKGASPSKPVKKRKGGKSVESETFEKEKPKSGATSEIPSSEDKKGKYISKEIVMSDEDEDASKNVSASPASTSSVKNQGKRRAICDTEGEGEPSGSPRARRKSEDCLPKMKEKPRIKAPDKSDEDEIAKVSYVKSDSELSILLDGPPTKRKKGSKKAEGKKSTGDKPEKKSRAKKETKQLSPDDEQIKKLKSLVVACGIRKIWSKELKDYETPSSQVSHLRNLLTDLGMKGRFSLEQAKAIKAKRDLSKEMEDVQEFAQRYAGDRPKRTVVKAKPAVVDDSSDEEPSHRPKSALRSIMDFLGDQSDSD